MLWRLCAVAAPVGLAVWLLAQLVDLVSEQYSMISVLLLAAIVIVCVVFAVRMARSRTVVATREVRLIGIIASRRFDVTDIADFETGSFLGNPAIAVVTARSRHLLPPMSQPAPKDLDWVRRRLDDWLTDARKSATESGHSGRE